MILSKEEILSKAKEIPRWSETEVKFNITK